jgi:predicted RecB family nuclease
VASDQKPPCLGLTYLFYPSKDDDPAVDIAKSICATCPFKEACLQQGMSEQEGIWGGATGRERKELREA